MTAPDVLSDELARQQRLLDLERNKYAVACALANETRQVADALAERLSHLLVALADCDVIVYGCDCDPPGFVIGASVPRADVPARHALGAAILAARIAVDAYNEESEP